MSRGPVGVRLVETRSPGIPDSNGHPAREIARVRCARTLWERFRGLMGAPPLPPGEALWLPACNAIHTAFVRGALDVVFLRGEEIIRVWSGVAPWRVVACRGADSVIELAAGEAVRLGLAPGQRLEVGPAAAHPPPGEVEQVA